MPHTIEEFEQAAKKKLPTSIYNHIAGGSDRELTLRRNYEAYTKFALLPRVFRETGNVNIDIDIFGIKAKSPIIIAPTAFQVLANVQGEIATAKAAENVGCIMVVSMMSNFSLEEIAASAKVSLWFQLHIHRDFVITENLIRRAECAGYKAIVITADIPYPGNRLRDIDNEFKLPSHCVPVNFIDSTTKEIKSEGIEFNPMASWEDIRRVKSITKLPIIVKGIMHYFDAIKALDIGVDGIIISNHGGRQLDGAAATIEVLPNIAKVLKNRIRILIDGGLYSGVNILKAIALGADAVLVGRPILWGLAMSGQSGVMQVMQCLHRELTLAMRLAGCYSISNIKEQGKSLILETSTDKNVYGDVFEEDNMR